VRVQWLLDLVFAVGFRCIICALVEGIEFVAAGSREAEGAVGGAREVKTARDERATIREVAMVGVEVMKYRMVVNWRWGTK
jgi:hypothetical protein